MQGKQEYKKLIALVNELLPRLEELRDHLAVLVELEENPPHREQDIPLLKVSPETIALFAAKRGLKPPDAKTGKSVPSQSRKTRNPKPVPAPAAATAKAADNPSVRHTYDSAQDLAQTPSTEAKSDAAEKREIYAALTAFITQHGRGSVGRIVECSGGTLTHNDIREMLDAGKYPMEKWRRVRAAIEAAEGT